MKIWACIATLMFLSMATWAGRSEQKWRPQMGFCKLDPTQFAVRPNPSLLGTKRRSDGARERHTSQICAPTRPKTKKKFTKQFTCTHHLITRWPGLCQLNTALISLPIRRPFRDIALQLVLYEDLIVPFNCRPWRTFYSPVECRVQKIAPQALWGNMPSVPY